MKWKFIAIYLIVLIFAFGLVTVITSNIISNNLMQRRVSDCVQSVNDFSVSIAYDLLTSDADSLYKLSVNKGTDISGRVLILNQYGIVQVDSFSRLTGVQLTYREVVEVLTGTKDASYGFHKMTSDGSGEWVGYYTSAIIENSRTIGAVVFSQSIQDVVDETGAIRNQYILVYLAASAVVIVLVYFFTNYISSPLEDLRNGAMILSTGDFSKRVEVKGKDELASLSFAFNTMAARLENVDRQRNEFVSNASHELKTPLSSMKILTESVLYQDNLPESVYKEFLGDINREIDRLTVLINDLLTMTKLQSSEGDLKKMAVDIDLLVGEVVGSLESLAADKDIALSYDADIGRLVKCYPTQLRQLVTNLVDNAIKYTQEGGVVRVRTLPKACSPKYR